MFWPGRPTSHWVTDHVQSHVTSQSRRAWFRKAYPSDVNIVADTASQVDCFHNVMSLLDNLKKNDHFIIHTFQITKIGLLPQLFNIWVQLRRGGIKGAISLTWRAVMRLSRRHWICPWSLPPLMDYWLLQIRRWEHVNWLPPAARVTFGYTQFLYYMLGLTAGSRDYAYLWLWW